MLSQWSNPLRSGYSKTEMPRIGMGCFRTIGWPNTRPVRPCKVSDRKSTRLNSTLFPSPTLFRAVEPAKVRVFQDRDAANRYGVLPDHRLAEHPSCTPLQSFHAGAALMWDDRAWKVVNVGNTMVSLRGEGGSLEE